MKVYQVSWHPYYEDDPVRRLFVSREVAQDFIDRYTIDGYNAWGSMVINVIEVAEDDGDDDLRFKVTLERGKWHVVVNPYGYSTNDHVDYCAQRKVWTWTGLRSTAESALAKGKAAINKQIKRREREAAKLHMGDGI